jgi:hypothetical protein
MATATRRVQAADREAPAGFPSTGCLGPGRLAGAPGFRGTRPRCPGGRARRAVGRFASASAGLAAACSETAWTALMEVGAPSVADAESFEPVQPGEGSLDHPAHLAEPEAVGDAASGNHRSRDERDRPARGRHAPPPSARRAACGRGHTPASVQSRSRHRSRQPGAAHGLCGDIAPGRHPGAAHGSPRGIAPGDTSLKGSVRLRRSRSPYRQERSPRLRPRRVPPSG